MGDRSEIINFSIFVKSDPPTKQFWLLKDRKVIYDGNDGDDDGDGMLKYIYWTVDSISTTNFTKNVKLIAWCFQKSKHMKNYRFMNNWQDSWKT